MPPARPRPALDDSRSESSSTIANLKERNTTGAGVSRGKKITSAINNDAALLLKTVATNGFPVNGLGIVHGASQASPSAPQTDWNSMAISTLQTYRAAYHITTPSAYALPHADLIYNSSSVGLRAPSQVLARKRLRELKLHRRKQAQVNGVSGGAANGVNKNNRVVNGKSKIKDDATSETSSQRSSKRRKETHDRGVVDVAAPSKINNVAGETSIALSIEPGSPTIQSQSAASGSQGNIDSHFSHSLSLLNPDDPEATIIGRQSPGAFATTVRKHFNAQQLNESETIARFAYVTKQQGYGHAPTASAAAAAAGTGGLPSGTSKDKDRDKDMSGAGIGPNSHVDARKVTMPIRMEGSDGDGAGWIMGTMGRQVRMSDMGGGGAFRLRFRPD